MKKMNEIIQTWNTKLFNAIQGKHLHILTEELLEIKEKVRTYYRYKKHEELKKLLFENRRFISDFKTTLETDDEIIAYEMGRLSGFLFVYEDLLEEQLDVEKYKTFCKTEKCGKRIFEILLKEDHISNNMLAKRLHISQKKLTEIMTTLNKMDQHLIATAQIGTYKYYYLTEMGKHCLNIIGD